VIFVQEKINLFVYDIVPIRLYASSGTSPGRGGPFGAVDLIAQCLYSVVFTHERREGKDK
jgi:hypothetical protein